MDVIETAIRNAFEKGDAEDRAFREKVYRSAFAALDRALKANPGITVELAMSRRKNLQAKIAAIESEFIPAVPAMPGREAAAPAIEPVRPDAQGAAASPREAPPVAVPPREPANAAREVPSIELDTVAPASGRETPVAPSVTANAAAGAGVAPPVSLAPPSSERRTEPAAPDFDTAPGPAGRPLPGSTLPPDPVLDTVPEADRQTGDDFEIPPQDEPEIVRERRRRPLAAMLVIVTILALVGIGGWWALQTGLIRLPGEIDTPLPTPPAEEEDFDPDEEEIGAPALPGEADSREWVSVFTPADATLVSAPGDTSAEVMQDDSGSFIRIRSSASGSAIIFDVGQGILERLAGKTAAFDIVARASEEGKDTQISVTCNFGELGDCGRKRYGLTITKADYLFEIDLPAKSPGAGGTIAINTDIEGGGKAIDVYEIKVAISN